MQDSSNFESSPTRSPHRRTAWSKSPFPVILQRARFMRAREVFMLSKFTIIAFLGIFIGAFTSTALAQENRCPGAATAKFEKLDRVGRQCVAATIPAGRYGTIVCGK